MDRRQVLTSLAAAVTAAMAPASFAQKWTGKQFRFVVGYPAGGVVDFAARTIAEGSIKRQVQPLSLKTRLAQQAISPANLSRDSRATRVCLVSLPTQRSRPIHLSPSSRQNRLIHSKTSNLSLHLPT